MNVSLIIPVFNNEKTLPLVFSSIDKQDYKDFEVIFVNDGSYDNSKIMIEQYIIHKKKHRLVNKNNGGLSAARISGINASIGKYIMFSDADDTFESNYISSHAKFIGKADIICSPIIEHSRNNTKIITKEPNDVVFLNHEEALLEITSNTIIGNYYVTKLFKRELFNNIDIQYNKPYEDIATIQMLFDKSQSTIKIPVASYHYIRRDNTLSSNSLQSYSYKIDALFYRRDYYSTKLLKDIVDIKIMDCFIEMISMYKYSKNDILSIKIKKLFKESNNKYMNKYITRNLKTFFLSPSIYHLTKKLLSCIRYDKN